MRLAERALQLAEELPSQDIYSTAGSQSSNSDKEVPRVTARSAHPSMRAMLGWSVGNSRLKDSKPPTARLSHACTSNTVYSTLPARRDTVIISSIRTPAGGRAATWRRKERLSLPYPYMRGSWWRRTHAAQKSSQRPVQTSSPGSGGVEKTQSCCNLAVTCQAGSPRPAAHPFLNTR